MKNLLLFFLCMYSFEGIAQSTKNVKVDSKMINDKVEHADTTIFPEKCLGIWEGMMYIYKYNELRDSVKVKFTAAKTNTIGTYVWKTEYLSPTRPVVKDYKLIVDDLNQGRYLLDEGDGLKLIEYNVNDKMYSLFKVNDIYLTATRELVGDRLIFEVTSGKEIVETKGVVNYSFANVQRVVLYRVNEY